MGAWESRIELNVMSYIWTMSFKSISLLIVFMWLLEMSCIREIVSIDLMFLNVICLLSVFNVGNLIFKEINQWYDIKSCGWDRRISKLSEPLVIIRSKKLPDLWVAKFILFTKPKRSKRERNWIEKLFLMSFTWILKSPEII